MKEKYLRLTLAVFLLALSPLTAQAQDTRIQELEHQLQERDKVILELLERVEALERRVGVERSASETHKEIAAPGTGATEGTQGEPGAIVVTEAEAERALERSLTREGVLLLPKGFLEVEPSLTYAREEDAAPSFVLSGGQTIVGETERNGDSFTADVALRLGLPWDSQFEIGIPYRWREVETVTNTGFSPIDSASESGADLGDVRVGFAKTLFRERVWRPDLVGRLTWDTDTGTKSDNGVALGGGFHELRGSLTAIKRQDPIVFVGGLSYEHTLEDDRIQPGGTIGANFGSFVALSPETSLRFLFSGAYRDETELSGSKINGSNQTIGTFVVGGSSLLAPGTLLNLSVGIGLTDEADDFSVLLSLPVRLDSPLF